MEASGNSGARVIGGCELPDQGAGNQIHVSARAILASNQ